MKIIRSILPFVLMSAMANANAGFASDQDQDGIPDRRDACPSNSFQELSRGVSSDGCPLHSDTDGIPDYRDQCPDTPRGVKINDRGCTLNVHLNVDNHVFKRRGLINIH